MGGTSSAGGDTSAGMSAGYSGAVTGQAGDTPGGASAQGGGGRSDGAAGSTGESGAAGRAGGAGGMSASGAGATASAGTSAAGNGGNAGAGGAGGHAGHAGNGGSAGAAPTVSCTAVANAATFSAPKSPGIVRVLWWQGGWLFATDSQVGKFAADGSVLIPFTNFSDPSNEQSVDPYLAVTDAGLLIAYSAYRSADNTALARIVRLKDDLTIQDGPFDIGPSASEIAGLSPDGQAVAWYQGYLAVSQGYRFSLFTPPMQLSGTTDVLNDQFASTETAEISHGAQDFFAFSRNKCTSLQRYDVTGSRVGTSVQLKPADRACPDDTNFYATRSSVRAVFAVGVHFVGFGEFGENGAQPWAGYAVVDDATAQVLAVKAITQSDSALFANMPTVAAFNGKFGLAWDTIANGSSTQSNDYFALVGADGTQLSAVVKLGLSASKFVGPILAASPTGFVAFRVTPENASANVYSGFNITCQ